MLILDTHALLWYLSDSKEMGDDLKQQISDSDLVAVSIASFWEIAIKQSIGKLKLEESVSEIEHICYLKDIMVLPIKPSELDVIKTLPNIHADPFDRLIISQTISESAILVTKDSNIHKYPVRTIWK